MRMQASLLASAVLTAEVDMLKQSSRSLSESSGVPRSSSRRRKVRNTLVEYVYKKVQLQEMTGLTWLL